MWILPFESFPQASAYTFNMLYAVLNYICLGVHMSFSCTFKYITVQNVPIALSWAWYQEGLGADLLREQMSEGMIASLVLLASQLFLT